MAKSFNKLSNVNKILLTLALTIAFYILIEVFSSVGIINRYWMQILLNVEINIILVVSLNITTGFLGQLTLGHAGFMAVGAYTSAYLSKNLLMGLPGSISLILALICGGIVALIFGAIVAYPTLRLKGDYLAIITLAFGEVIKNLLLNLEAVGGASGYYGIPRNSTFTLSYIFVIITVLLSYSLIKSKQGRAIISVREDEIAAEASGINTNKFKMLAFVFAAFFAGIAGGLYAHNIGILEPKVFKLDKSIELLVMVVLGGMGNIWGSILAAAALTILPELLRSVAQYRLLIYSLVLIFMMFYRYDAKLIALRMKVKSLFSKKGGSHENS
ncbi:MAG: branched-chain amino acid ABC transporter permease [Clostridiales bacterium]|nr:MAG: branched-chain amino acid ABC transporter permease [Clostridiales bacterium]